MFGIKRYPFIVFSFICIGLFMMLLLAKRNDIRVAIEPAFEEIVFTFNYHLLPVTSKLHNFLYGTNTIQVGKISKTDKMKKIVSIYKEHFFKRISKEFPNLIVKAEIKTTYLQEVLIESISNVAGLNEKEYTVSVIKRREYPHSNYDGFINCGYVEEEEVIITTIEGTQLKGVRLRKSKELQDNISVNLTIVVLASIPSNKIKNIDHIYNLR